MDKQTSMNWAPLYTRPTHAEPPQAIPHLRPRPLHHLQLLPPSPLPQRRPRPNGLPRHPRTHKAEAPVPRLRLRPHARARPLTAGAPHLASEMWVCRMPQRKLTAAQASGTPLPHHQTDGRPANYCAAPSQSQPSCSSQAVSRSPWEASPSARSYPRNRSLWRQSQTHGPWHTPKP